MSVKVESAPIWGIADWLVNCAKLRKINKLINKSLTGGCAFWSFNSWLDKICTFEGTKWKSITKNYANTKFEFEKSITKNYANTEFEFESLVGWKEKQLIIFGREYLGTEYVKGIVVVRLQMHCVGRQTSDFTYIPNFFHYSKTSFCKNQKDLWQ